MKALILASAALTTLAVQTASAKVPRLRADNINEVVAAMTLEEKVNLIVGTGMDNNGNEAPDAVIGATRKIVPGAAGTTYPIKRLGIPAIVLADGPAGLRIDPKREGDPNSYYCTHFPIGTLLACTWDTALVENVGRAIGEEVRDYGVDVILSPGMNIHRNPLNGRNFEYYSEDPLVTGKIAAAYVRGVQANGVGTSIKHFAVNNQETNRTANNAIVDPRTLREIYLRGFEIAVKESQPWTVMTSYNYLNGRYTSENPELIESLLRNEWGFQGAVMTDWYGGKDAVAQMIAGNDMLQPGHSGQRKALIDAVRNGALDESVIDRNVAHILSLVVKSPAFFNGRHDSHKPDLEKHAAVTRQSATEGMVLLKNDNNVLPLNKDIKKIGLFGVTSYDFIAGGTGSGNVNRAYTVSLFDGLRNAGFILDDALKAKYETHITATKPIKKDFFMPEKLAPEIEIDPTAATQYAEAYDAAIITLGRISGEFYDRTDRDFNLSEAEKTMITNLCTAFRKAGKPTIVVLNIGGVIETASWRDMPDAVLCAWQAGQEGGNSVTDILTGAACPSGKLSMTFPVKYTDHLSSLNFPMDQSSACSLFDGRRLASDIKDVDYTEYDEGIFVGYRYFDTKNKHVSYPFGYGLSYTTFDYSEPKIETAGDSIKLTFDITNTGNRAGKEIAQLYVAAPEGRLVKPAKELRGFVKTDAIAPGKTQTVSFNVSPADLASFDDTIHAWVTDNGIYTFMIGASVEDIRHKVSIPVGAYLRPTARLFTSE